MTPTAHLTLRDRRLLANLGKRRAPIATPYVDRKRLDHIIAQEIAKVARAEIEGPPKPSRRLTRAAARELGARMLQIVGEARFSWGGIAASAGAAALAVALAMMPVLDEAERGRARAETAAYTATAQALGHVTVSLAGRPEDVANHSAAIAATLRPHHPALPAPHAHLTAQASAPQPTKARP